jgi:hypothetical protein
MTRTETRQELRDHLDRIFKIWLEQAQEEAASSEDAEDIEKEFIHDWYNGLDSYKEAFKAEHKNQIKQKGQHYPRKWMEADKLISSLLTKYRISDILNTIEAWKDGDYLYLLSPKGKRFNEEYPRGWTTYGEKKHNLAVFIANSRFYKTILPSLGIAESTLHKYLQAFSKAGILQKLPNTGKYRNIPIYAVGYFSEYGERKFKLNRFLKSDNKEALMEFTLQHRDIEEAINTGKKQKAIELVYSEEAYLSQRRDSEEAAKYRHRKRQ